MEKLEDMYFTIGDYTVAQIADVYKNMFADTKLGIIFWYNENMPHIRKRVSTTLGDDIITGVSLAIDEKGFLGFPVDIQRLIK